MYILAFLAKCTLPACCGHFPPCLLSFAITQFWHLWKKDCLKCATNQGTLPVIRWAYKVMLSVRGWEILIQVLQNGKHGGWFILMTVLPLSTLLIRSCCPCLVASLFNIFFDLWATSYIIPMICIIFKVRISFR